MTKLDWGRAKIPDPGAVREVPDVKRPETLLSSAEQQQRRSDRIKEEQEQQERKRLIMTYESLKRSAKKARLKREKGHALTQIEDATIKAFYEIRKKLGF